MIAPHDWGFILVQAPNGKWCIADPLDDADGFYLECDTEQEAMQEFAASGVVVVS